MGLTINSNLLAVNTSRHLQAHYSSLGTSIQRLASGLRINSAADDAAGLAISELMSADIASMQQGIRNANDAISLIQTADGAMQVIDEKLIRMKELSEQASTGTYDSTQRSIINSEFLQMAYEIDRIANSTEFNNIKLLDGSLSGAHDGSGPVSTGELKIHFGATNNSAEDYYYINIPPIGLEGLGLKESFFTYVTDTTSTWDSNTHFPTSSGVVNLGLMPVNEGFAITGITDQDGLATSNSDIQLFTRDGKHIAGTTDLTGISIENILTEANGFFADAVYDKSSLNGTGNNVPFADPSTHHEMNTFNYNGMEINYSGNGNPGDSQEQLFVDNVTEPLIMLVTGKDRFYATSHWRDAEGGRMELTSIYTTIETQEKAQNTLEQIDNAIIIKDNARAHLGALQNRFENTISNLEVQTENLKASKSRITDTDVAKEMTTFVKTQILAQSAVSMLAQANMMPNLAYSLIG